MSQPLTFPCPFCGRRMGVGMELAGKHVRCPHCKQIVLAPTAAAPTAAPAFVPPKPPPPPQPDSDPVFNTAPRESADSILSDPEESDDEVFSSSKNGTRMRIPDLPDPANPWGINDPVTRIDNRDAPPPAPRSETASAAERGAGRDEPDANPFAFPPAAPPPPPVQPPPPPVQQPRAEVKSNNETTAEYVNPFQAFDAPTPSSPPAPRNETASAAERGAGRDNPPVAPPPPPVAAPKPFVPKPPPPPTVPTAPANPWSGLDEMAANPTVTAPPIVPVPQPVFQPPPPPEDLPTPVPVPVPRARQQAATGGISKGVFWAVVGYALVATALALYGLFIKSGDAISPGHPLSTIPDNFGEFDPVQRKKVGKLAVPHDGELPPEQKVALGKKLEIGQLEIEPLHVKARKLEIVGQLTAGGLGKLNPPTPALVLTLKVTNKSDDLAVFPLDPAFNRKEQSGVPTPATGLVVGGKTFWGGEIEWPFRQQVKRMFEGEQTEDVRPLKPKETRNYVVFTAADGQARTALKAHAGTATWRVQVRRGLVPFKGKDVPVTAIVGVEFTKADVSGL
jgi:hypothetical protein